MRTSILLLSVFCFRRHWFGRNITVQRDSVRLTGPRTNSIKPCLLLFTNNLQSISTKLKTMRTNLVILSQLIHSGVDNVSKGMFQGIYR